MAERRWPIAPNSYVRGLYWVRNRTIYAFVLHQLGEQETAAPLFDEALRIGYAAVGRGDETSFARFEVASIHAFLGDTVEALDWLERSYQRGYRQHRVLEQHPMFESLRGNDQFRDILARMETDVARERDRVEAEGIADVVDSVIAAAGIERGNLR